MSFLSGSINPSTTTPADDIGKIKNDLAVLRAVLGGGTDPDVPFAANVTILNDGSGVPYAFKLGALLVQVFRVTGSPTDTAGQAGTFPQPFTTACLGVVMQAEYTSGLTVDTTKSLWGWAVQARTKTGFTFLNDGPACNFFCIAFGY